MTSRCDVRAAYSGATCTVIRTFASSFTPLNAGCDGAARHPYPMLPSVFYRI